MARTIKFLVVGVLGLLVITGIFCGCSNKTVTSPTALAAASIITPTTNITSPTQTSATYEQKRNDVMKYLKAFNDIENSYQDASAKIVFPQDLNTAADLANWNTAMNNYLSVYDVAINCLMELKPSLLETATEIHLQQAKSIYQSQRSANKVYQEAVNSLNEADMNLKWNELIALDSGASALNRATEQLMLQYNILDDEVSYRFRGI